jgi:hypothetical protein
MIRATAHHNFARRKGRPSLNPDLMKDFLLETFPNPERKGCPDDKTLEALAEDRLPAEHPARLHVGSCSECYAEYRHYRLDWEESKATASTRNSDALSGTVEVTPSSSARVPKTSRLRAVPLALAASLIVMCSGGYLAIKHYHAANAPGTQVASSQPVSAAVDLFNSGTLRGADDDTTPLQEVSLPAAIVHLSVLLPRFSDAGSYKVAVSTDKIGSQIVASGMGNAVEEAGDKVTLNVTLDLRGARPGAYFLATVRGTDNGTYYYPLKIK